jgi:cytochrome P450
MESQPSASQPPPFQGNLARPRFLYRQWMLAGNPALFFDRLVRDFGDFVHYRGLFSFYLINHPALVKQVLQETNKSFDKHSVIYNRFRNAFGNGLVVAEGDRWRRQRKLMQPMFGPNAIKQFFALMVDSAEQMAQRWQPACRAGQAGGVPAGLSITRNYIMLSTS